MKAKILVPGLFLLLLLTTAMPAQARTKQDAINQFFDNMHSSLGFKNSKTDPVPSVSATSAVIQLAPFVDYKLPDTSDLYYFFQAHQNPDYGFGNKEDEPSDFNATIQAIYGLIGLKTNISILIHWNALTYLNKTITNIVYNVTVTENATIYEHKANFTASEMLSIVSFIQVANLFNFKWVINTTRLVLEALDMQFENGSYISLLHAEAAITLLDLFDYAPVDTYGATQYLLSLRQGKNGFSQDQGLKPTIKDTYTALNLLSILGYDLDSMSEKGALVKYLLDSQTNSGGFAEQNEVAPSIQTTKHVLFSLFLLNSLSELQQKELLVEQGFLAFPVSMIPFVSIFVCLFRKRKT